MFVSYNKHFAIRYCCLNGTAIMTMGTETLVYAFKSKRKDSAKSTLWYLFANKESVERGYLNRMKRFIKKSMLWDEYSQTKLRFDYHECNPDNIDLQIIQPDKLHKKESQNE